jgi:serine phosphatase RsbU (regulator of sigma subunit)/PAS domain-containing protein
VPQEDLSAELTARRDALRQAAAAPGADPAIVLDAALVELDAAVESVRELAAGPDDPDDGGGEDLRAERRLLRSAFHEAPVPLFLLERDGTVRRANLRAGELIGASPGYATGKPFATFADPSSRAPVRSQLAAVVRTGKPGSFAARVLAPDGPVTVTLNVETITLPGDPAVLIVSAAPGETPAKPAARRATAKAQDIQRMTRRMDMVTAVTRLLLDNSTFSEAVTLQRCARLLAGELASWVIVDVERGGQLRRQIAVGPRDPALERAARAVRETPPGPDTVCWQVHATGKSALAAHVEDDGLLGAAADGNPLLTLIGAASFCCVPISDGTTGYGALTLVRAPGEGPFELADLALAEALGEDLGVAIRVDRMFKRGAEVTQALQASLLPSRLPEVPGLDLAAAYIGATEWQEISGDFYDVFPAPDGAAWGFVVGDVSGKGEEAAAMTAAARHSARAMALSRPDPAGVLRGVNEVLLTGDYEDRFVTAKVAYLTLEDGAVRVRVAGAGHPGPAVVRADGRVEVLEGGGLPLGMFPGLEPEVSELVLRDGDLLFFYTDGVTEARGADMSYFEDQLADQLAAAAGGSAGETVRAVQELVTEFSGGELRDDMTMLAVKVSHSSS